MAETTIGARTRIEGLVSGGDVLRVHGEVSGNIQMDGVVIIEAEGRVRAEVHADEVSVLGSVDGFLVGRKKVEIQPDGRLVGDVRTARILISDGAVFRGRVDMDVEEG